MSPVTSTLVVPQAIEVSVLQAPEKTCTRAPEVLRFDPKALSVTVAFAVDATKAYQTSSSGEPVAHPTGMLLLADVFHTVPELLVVPRVNTVAPEQLSLAGGGV
jgi:hypothetical protein